MRWPFSCPFYAERRWTGATELCHFTYCESLDWNVPPENPWQHSFVLIVTSATGLVELSLRFALFRMCSLGRRCVALM